ncbi:MAG TPA: FAD-dependent monooxygenase [Candidatus Acidoferrum sp.]|nr:FAD-dependent monooxygenase [Candidatus Acidoferrum sp.]
MHILISGSGIAGLTLAYCAQRGGHSCTLVEKAGAKRPEGYMIDFFGTGYDVAERLGLLPDLQQIHYPIDRLVFFNPRGRERYSLSYPAIRKIFYDRHFNFLRGDLENLLYSKVREHAQFRFSTTIESVEQDASSVSATLSDGSRIDADLLVGADGFHSRVREIVFGEESRFSRFLGYNTAAFLLPSVRVPISPDAFSTLTVPGRQFGLYPVRGGKLATYFVYRAENPPKHLRGEAAIEELRSAFSDVGWILPTLFEHIEPGSFYFDQVAQIELPQWSKGRVFLLGDACYCVSLIAGQGASLAMAGAYLLAQKLHSAASDISSAAAFYENRLRPPIEKKQRAARKLARRFVPSSSDGLFIRDLVMRFSAYAPFRPLIRRSLSPESIFHE